MTLIHMCKDKLKVIRTRIITIIIFYKYKLRDNVELTKKSPLAISLFLS